MEVEVEESKEDILKKLEELKKQVDEIEITELKKDRMDQIGDLYQKFENTEEAKNWYLKSIQMGSIEAYDKLALLYTNEEAYDKALETYHKKLEIVEEDDGKMKTFHEIAWVYDEHLKEYDEAKLWYERAKNILEKSSTKFIPTIFNLADIYKDEGNYEKAIELFESIEDEDPDVLSKMISIYQRKQDNENIKKYVERGLEIEDPHCQNMYANILEYGRYGFEKNLKLAFEYFQKAANHPVNFSDSAQRRIPHLYYNGIGCERDLVKSHKALLAIKNHNWITRFNLAMDYENGTGCDRDIQKAFDMYLELAEEGDPDGMYMVGRFKETGKLGPINLVEAIEWYRKGAEKEDKDCYKKLYDLTTKDRDAKRGWLEKWALKNWLDLQYKYSEKTKELRVQQGFIHDWVSKIRKQEEEILELKHKIDELEMRPPCVECGFEGGEIYKATAERFNKNIGKLV